MQQEELPSGGGLGEHWRKVDGCEWKIGRVDAWYWGNKCGGRGGGGQKWEGTHSRIKIICSLEINSKSFDGRRDGWPSMACGDKGFPGKGNK